MKRILKYLKQTFCKHTYIPSTIIGADICIDCQKLREHIKP